jgi:hypothetical protein
VPGLASLIALPIAVLSEPLERSLGLSTVLNCRGWTQYIAFLFFPNTPCTNNRIADKIGRNCVIKYLESNNF